MLKQIIAKIKNSYPAPEVHAHCDGPCGVYDPASARITAEAVLSMTKKITELEKPDPSDKAANIAYHNTLSRYIAIKEEQAQKTVHTHGFVYKKNANTLLQELQSSNKAVVRKTIKQITDLHNKTASTKLIDPEKMPYTAFPHDY